MREFLKAVLGGFCIGIGSTIYLRINGTFTGSNIVAALFFTAGLFIICTRGYNLYTGKICYLPNAPNKPRYTLDLLLILFGNFVGTVFFALVLRLTSVYTGISGSVNELVEMKMNSSYLSLFVLAVICNIFIFIAVDGFANNPHAIGKYLGMFFGISGFILFGAEHSIAGIYYWSLSGILFAQPLQSLVRIFVIIAGNSVGGMLFAYLDTRARQITNNS